MSGSEDRNAGLQRFSAVSVTRNHRARSVGLLFVGLLATFAVGTIFMVPRSETQTSPTQISPAKELRLGYFANVTHAPALIAEDRGIFADALQGDGTELETQIFNAGPAAVEALNSGALDAAYLGPSPALTSYLASHGKSLKIVAGVTNGGASLVVSSKVNGVEDLPGSNLGTPQFGGTQDIALRHYLLEQGLTETVTVSPSSNGTVPQLFAREVIDGAWLPEPYASLLVDEYGAHRLLNEASLWPDGKFPTTVLVVRQEFLAQHPDSVAKLVAANAQAIDWLNSASVTNRLTAVQKALKKLNGNGFSDAVIAAALEQVSFSEVPLENTFETLVAHLEAVDLGESGDVTGIVDDRWIGRNSWE